MTGSQEVRPAFNLSDVVPRNYGVDTAKGQMAVIIPKFSFLPTKNTSSFWPPSMGLEHVSIVIYEGNFKHFQEQ